ncbi:hypothetical protein BMS3Abin02_00028 [bacterium BMS3Abin02]|nr:hypothetical protein BMS3Abin02_00028 [bacterium BMS3Abin02]GBE23139.1 hypothetical protein BMS3Bbin01_02522 [bacterium BMS3Bbin01]
MMDTVVPVGVFQVRDAIRPSRLSGDGFVGSRMEVTVGVEDGPDRAMPEAKRWRIAPRFLELWCSPGRFTMGSIRFPAAASHAGSLATNRARCW